MKFLADMGVSMTIVQNLRESGYDVVHLREEGLQRLPDINIVEKAKQEGRIILTFDLDFADILAASSEFLTSVVIFRLKNTLPVFASARLFDVLSECVEDLQTGAIVILQDNRYRMRRLPI